MVGWGENVQEEVPKVGHCREKRTCLNLDLVPGADRMPGRLQGNSNSRAFASLRDGTRKSPLST